MEWLEVAAYREPKPETSAVDHYRTYLRGELARLRSRSVATDLVSTRACATAGLPAGPASELVARFATQPRTDAYVETRADEQLVRLTECMSEWRNKNVRFELSPSQRTEFRSVVVGAIRLNDAEPWLHDRFEQNVRQLTRIGLDPEVLADPAYMHHRPGENRGVSDLPRQARFRCPRHVSRY